MTDSEYNTIHAGYIRIHEHPCIQLSAHRILQDTSGYMLGIRIPASQAGYARIRQNTPRYVVERRIRVAPRHSYLPCSPSRRSSASSSSLESGAATGARVKAGATRFTLPPFMAAFLDERVCSVESSYRTLYCCVM